MASQASMPIQGTAGVHPGTRYRGAMVPYITAWSSEQAHPARVIERPWSGIAYPDETPADRDEHGVLWRRVPAHPGHGRPKFGTIHTVRQRRAMLGTLCQVCGNLADQSPKGTLWLLKDHRDDWPGWPNRMAVTEPPVCRPCARIARRTCPALRQGHVGVRVRHAVVAGVYGVRYEPGPRYPKAVADAIVAFDDPAIRWTCAAQLVRELNGCGIVDLDAELGMP